MNSHDTAFLLKMVNLAAATTDLLRRARLGLCWMRFQRMLAGAPQRRRDATRSCRPAGVSRFCAPFVCDANDKGAPEDGGLRYGLENSARFPALIHYLPKNARKRRRLHPDPLPVLAPRRPPKPLNGLSEGAAQHPSRQGPRLARVGESKQLFRLPGEGIFLFGASPANTRRVGWGEWARDEGAGAGAQPAPCPMKP